MVMMMTTTIMMELLMMMMMIAALIDTLMITIKRIIHSLKYIYFDII